MNSRFMRALVRHRADSRAFWRSRTATTVRSSPPRSWRSTTRASTPAHTEVRRRTTTIPTTPVGAVRPPFRGHRRRRSAGRPGAGGAVRLCARPDLARRPASASPAPSRTTSGCGHRPGAAAASLADIARTEVGTGRRHHRRHRDPLHPHHRAGGPRPGRSSTRSPRARGRRSRSS